MPLIDSIDTFQKKSEVELWADVCSEIFKNTAMAFPQVQRWRLTKPRAGRLYAGRDDQLERWALFGMRLLREVLGSIDGLEIIEIGPGDFMTSGYSMLAAGAKSYTVIDRYQGNYEAPEAKVWYRGIQDAFPRLFPELQWPEYLNAEDFPESYQDRVSVLSGTIEEAHSPKKYDVVCSIQVGEHVHDIDAFAQATAKLLKSNGVAIHRVDFGPHDCWSFYEERLVFLRFPDWLWWLMGSNRGTPNRERYHRFCEAFEKAGLKVDVVGLELFTDEVIANARLNKKFKGTPVDSLKIGTAIFICRL